MPLSFTDLDLDVIIRSAAPLEPEMRSAFIEAVADALQGRELGDGDVARACVGVQRRYWSPPIIDGAS